MKSLPIQAILLMLLSLSVSGCHRTNAEESGEASAHGEHEVIIATSPKAMDVVITKPYVCQIHSRRHIEVRAIEPGYLQEVNIREGQAVKKGDVLFRLLPILYEADLNAKRAEADLARIEYEQTWNLYNASVQPTGGSSSTGSGIVSKVAVAKARAKLAKAEAEVKRAEAELSFTQIKAPFDGIVDRQEEQLGALVEEGALLTTLSDNSVMWVYFNVPEAQYLEYMTSGAGHDPEHPQRLRIPDADIRLQLADGRVYEHSAGDTVTIEGNFNNETGNIAFRADFPNPDRLLRHGQTGNVLIHSHLSQAIVIPQRATFELLDQQYVWVIDKDNLVHRRLVTIAHELEDIFVISKGLDVNDKIILEGIRQVHDGEKTEYEFREPDEVLAHLKYHAE